MNILVITLSNIGDVVLTLPVINLLMQDFPEARMSILAGPKARELFEKDPRIYKFIEYDKSAPFMKKFAVVRGLMAEGYDNVIDLRDSIIPLFLGKWRFSNFRKPPKHITHMRDRHLWRLLGRRIDNISLVEPVYITNEDKMRIDKMLDKYGIKNRDNIIIVAPGAKNSTKRWMFEGFAEVCNRLIEELNAQLVIVGDAQDKDIAQKITAHMRNSPINAVGLTNLRELAYLIKCSRLVISNDSACIHIAGCIDVPAVVIFGPTDHKKYGPVGKDDIIIHKEENFKCAPCEESLCRMNPQSPTNALCMQAIKPDEVFDAARMILLRTQRKL